MGSARSRKHLLEWESERADTPKLTIGHCVFGTWLDHGILAGDQGAEQ